MLPETKSLIEVEQQIINLLYKHRERLVIVKNDKTTNIYGYDIQRTYKLENIVIDVTIKSWKGFVSSDIKIDGINLSKKYDNYLIRLLNKCTLPDIKKIDNLLEKCKELNRSM